MRTPISPLLLLLARGASAAPLQRELYVLGAETRFELDHRIALLAALADNPRLDPQLREELGGHRWGTVRKQLLRTGTVTTAEAARWYRGETRHQVAQALVTHVADPGGRFAAELGERIGHPRLDHTIATCPDLPVEVRLAAAERLVGYPRVPVGYLTDALRLAAGSVECEQRLRAVTAPARWAKRAPRIPRPVPRLPERPTGPAVAGWLRTRHRPVAEVLAVVAAAAEPARVAVARGYADPSGAVGNLLVDLAAGSRGVLAAVAESPHAPLAVRKRAVLALPAAAPDAHRLAHRLRRATAWGNTDPKFADAFYRAAAVPGRYAWQQLAQHWTHLGAAALADGARQVMAEDLAWASPSEPRVQQLMWSANTPPAVKAQLADWFTRAWQRAHFAAGGHHPLRAEADRFTRMYAAVAEAAATGAVPRLVTADLVAAGASTPVRALATVVTDALGAGPVTRAQLELLNGLGAGATTPLCDLMDALGAADSAVRL